jgi:hypothetical protein
MVAVADMRLTSCDRRGRVRADGCMPVGGALEPLSVARPRPTDVARQIGITRGGS